MITIVSGKKYIWSSIQLHELTIDSWTGILYL